MEKSVKITLIISGVILVLALMLMIGFNSLMPDTNTISVTGLAKVATIPDLVTVNFIAETSGQTSQEATQKNSEVIDELITSLVKEGFERKDIQTQNFNVYPDYKWINNQRIENGYKATHQIRVELSTDRSDLIGDVIDAGVAAGAGVSYINFELTQEKQNTLKAEAMKLAAQDAKIKAEAVAEGLGKKTGKIVSLSVDDFGYRPWSVYSGNAMLESAAEAKVATTNIAPSEQEIQASVRAVYKIR